MAILNLATAKETNKAKPFSFGNPSIFKLGKLEDESSHEFTATDKAESYDVVDYQGNKTEAIRIYVKEGHRVRINDPEILDKIEVGTKLKCVKQSWTPDTKDGKPGTRKIPYLFLDGIAQS